MTKCERPEWTPAWPEWFLTAGYRSNWALSRDGWQRGGGQGAEKRVSAKQWVKTFDVNKGINNASNHLKTTRLILTILFQIGLSFLS